MPDRTIIRPDQVRRPSCVLATLPCACQIMNSSPCRIMNSRREGKPGLAARRGGSRGGKDHRSVVARRRMGVGFATIVRPGEDRRSVASFAYCCGESAIYCKLGGLQVECRGILRILLANDTQTRRGSLIYCRFEHADR